MNNCIFCEIIGDESKHIWSNEVAVAFKTISPQAPVHVLVVSREHMVNLDDLTDEALAGKLLLAVREVAHLQGLKGEWRMRVNNGEKAGQTVPHLHFHILGGEQQAE